MPLGTFPSSNSSNDIAVSMGTRLLLKGKMRKDTEAGRGGRTRASGRRTEKERGNHASEDGLPHTQEGGAARRGWQPVAGGHLFEDGGKRGSLRPTPERSATALPTPQWVRVAEAKAVVLRSAAGPVASGERNGGQLPSRGRLGAHSRGGGSPSGRTRRAPGMEALLRRGPPVDPRPAQPRGSVRTGSCSSTKEALGAPGDPGTSSSSPAAARTLNFIP